MFGGKSGTRVSVTHSQCGPNPAIYCNTKAIVQYGGARVQIEGNEVSINGVVVPVTGTTVAGPGFNVTRRGPNDFLIVTPNGNVQIKGYPITNAAGESFTYFNIIVTANAGLVPDGGICQCKPGEQIANPTTAINFRRSVDVPVALTDPQFIHSCMLKKNRKRKHILLFTLFIQGSTRQGAMIPSNTLLRKSTTLLTHLSLLPAMETGQLTMLASMPLHFFSVLLFSMENSSTLALPSWTPLPSMRAALMTSFPLRFPSSLL